MYFHSVDPIGVTHRHWLEAEQSSHKVGGAQKETEEEIKDALSRGKSTAIHIGTAAMGTRFNVQMLIQLPVKQKKQPRSKYGYMIAECNELMGGVGNSAGGVEVLLL